MVLVLTIDVILSQLLLHIKACGSPVSFFHVQALFTVFRWLAVYAVCVPILFFSTVLNLVEERSKNFQPTSHLARGLSTLA